MLNLGDKLAAAGVVSQSAVDDAKQQREEEERLALEAEEATVEYDKLRSYLDDTIREEMDGFVEKYGPSSIPLGAVKAMRRAVSSEKGDRDAEATGRREWAKFLSAARAEGKQWP